MGLKTAFSQGKNLFALLSSILVVMVTVICVGPGTILLVFKHFFLLERYRNIICFGIWVNMQKQVVWSGSRHQDDLDQGVK